MGVWKVAVRMASAIHYRSVHRKKGKASEMRKTGVWVAKEKYREVEISTNGEGFWWKYAGTKGSAPTLEEAMLQIDGVLDNGGLLAAGRESVNASEVMVRDANVTSTENILKYAKANAEAGVGLRFILRVLDDMKELVRNKELLVSEELINDLIKEAKYEETRDQRQVTMWVHENHWGKEIIADGRRYYCHLRSQKGELVLQSEDLDTIKQGIHHVIDYSDFLSFHCEVSLEKGKAEAEVRRMNDIFDVARDAIKGGDYEESDRNG